MSEGFLTTPRTAELFFRVCRRYKIDREGYRVALLREIVRRKKAKYIRDVKAFTEGKRIGIIVPNGTVIVDPKGDTNAA